MSIDISLFYSYTNEKNTHVFTGQCPLCCFSIGTKLNVLIAVKFAYYQCYTAHQLKYITIIIEKKYIKDLDVFMSHVLHIFLDQNAIFSLSLPNIQVKRLYATKNCSGYSSILDQCCKTQWNSINTTANSVIQNLKCKKIPNYEPSKIVIQNPVAEECFRNVINLFISKYPEYCKLGRDTQLDNY